MNGTVSDKITANEIVKIHSVLAEKFADSEDPISPPGIKDRAMLESAAARPFQSAGRKLVYGDIHKKAAALFHALIHNHPFYNGNKRTALLAAQVLLARKKYWLYNTYDDEIFDFTRKTAAHELTDSGAARPNSDEELEIIAKWFEGSTRKVQKGEHPLTYRSLKEILERFEFNIAPPEGYVLNIYNKQGEQVYRIKKGGMQGFAPYDIDTISELRKALKLDSKNGCDSGKFYGDKGIDDITSELIDLRVEVMKRLAKT